MDQPKAWIQDALVQPEPDGHFVMIPLTQGKFAVVDEVDAERIMSLGAWHAAKSGNSRTYYAARGDGRRSGRLLMHVLIAGCKMPDHINRNGLDNRRVNLRPATGTQNQANQGLRSNNTSGYKGVGLRNGRWEARIKANGRAIRLGRFNGPAEAARAYNEAAREMWGEYAWLNPLPADMADRAWDNAAPHQAFNGLQRNNKSGYRGVHWHRRSGKWVARIKVDGRQVHLGCFDDAVEAARAFNRAALEVRGKDAWLNPLPDVTEPPAA